VEILAFRLRGETQRAERFLKTIARVAIRETALGSAAKGWRQSNRGPDGPSRFNEKKAELVSGDWCRKRGAGQILAKGNVQKSTFLLRNRLQGDDAPSRRRRSPCGF